ncbi:hypothetical protein U9M48_002236 [Paspalum notatum var. saurae]|uniref:Protein kinase domain-containing protein n=1 Tax=Paspalum notatum var. saurae TaxID=547442 RepID=A0AAQ3SFV3_PASNO
MATIASQLHNPPFILSAVPCPSTIVQLLLCFLLLSLPKPCTSVTVKGAFDQLPGYLCLTNMSTCRATWQRVDGGLASYMKNNHPADFNLSQKGWFFAQDYVILNDQDGDASFSVGFTMSAYQPNNETKETSNLFFATQPVRGMLPFPPQNWQILGPSGSSGPTSSTDSSGRHISVDIGTAQDNGTFLLYLGLGSNIIWVQIGIEPPADNSSSVASKYIVWIDYNHVSHRISVYADDASEGMPKRAKAIDSKIVSVEAGHVILGLFALMGQLLQVHTWNLTVQDPVSGVESGSQEKKIILCSVLGSAAATAIATALVLLYVNSKDRRWKKEQDELTKIMQGIPGVPTHVDFADIKKATKNFHDTMKLGKGGFGAVYRCTLPARASRTGQAMDVAVKKFMREVEDRRYSDFLAEVSIINRLRHKNIVPLIGWSYNKGEPLLIYEYMANGSLDQHIFLNGSAGQQQEVKQDASLWQWHTRYAIARDIATGLHYVHHEHEPMVLHRDIKASNIMLDADFRARLGDFGIACTVAVNRSSVTGIAGTWGYIAPDYTMSYKATRQTDIYAFGVLILEVVTGKKNGDIPPDDDHITDWIWRLHGEGKLLDAVDASLLAIGEDDNEVADDEAKRLLLLGLACTNPNPFDRPSMADAQFILATPGDRPRYRLPSVASLDCRCALHLSSPLCSRFLASPARYLVRSGVFSPP